MKYTGGEEWDSLWAYVRAVKRDHLSVLTGLAFYQETIQDVKTNMVGFVTQDGIEIRGVSYHYIDRTIGNEGADIIRKGVPWDEARDALLNPYQVLDGRTTGKGNVRLYYGQSCVVSVNATTGQLIQTRPSK